MTPLQRQRGLTLPEVLIALAIFAMISSTAVYVLRLAVDAREQLVDADSAIREMQIARVFLKEDLAQAALRRVRDEFGDRLPGPMIGGDAFLTRPPVEGEEPLLFLVRHGWSNPENSAPRSNLQAVEYLLIGDRLVRRTRPYLDDARGQPRIDRALLHGVSGASIEFLIGDAGAGPQWATQWPAPQATELPRAVRLHLTTSAYGEMEQLFWIGAVGPK